MAIRKKTSVVSTKDAVYASAASLFSSHGFNGVSTEDIAADAGVNKAMIYYHFTDKLALYRAVVCEGLQAMSETTGYGALAHRNSGGGASSVRVRPVAPAIRARAARSTMRRAASSTSVPRAWMLLMQLRSASVVLGSGHDC